MDTQPTPEIEREESLIGLISATIGGPLLIICLVLIICAVYLALPK